MTPVFTSRTLDERVGARIHVKAECFQRGGAFKFRGAFNQISSLDESALRRGVLAYSSGNHAQAVAIAAALLKRVQESPLEEFIVATEVAAIVVSGEKLATIAASN